MYQRKTKDVWDIQQYTSIGWEIVCCESTYKDARERVREYRNNEPELPIRIRMVRERIETHEVDV